MSISCHRLTQSCRLLLCRRYKGKGLPVTCHGRHTGGVDVELHSFLTSALGVSGWSMPRSGRFPHPHPLPWEGTVLIVQEAEWGSAPFWTGLAPAGVRSLERPYTSESLYRLSHPGHRVDTITVRKVSERLITGCS